MVKAGAIVLAGGVVLGGVFAAVAASPPAPDGSFNGLNHTIGFAAGAATAGVLGLGVGIPLIAVGARQVPDEDLASESASASSPLAPREVNIGLGSVGAGWSF